MITRRNASVRAAIVSLLKQVNFIFCTDVTVKATTGNLFVYAVTKLFLFSINLFGSYMVVLKILALILTAIILVPSGAHLFELPGKINLDREAYFIVQGIYYGWALLLCQFLQQFWLMVHSSSCCDEAILNQHVGYSHPVS